ncbi:MAG TPA: response regulator [Myxococcota bacterium]|jgi:two-component system response regulator|nr:response regulator [Myxococcota bacterium]
MSGANGVTKDILLVDDDELDVEIAMMALAEHGLDRRTEVKLDSLEALDYLERMGRAPRVVLLDLRMPRIDGFEMLRRLRARGRYAYVPIVVVSSSQLDGDIAESYRLGANSFVRKRFGPDRPGSYLVDVVRYWLDLNEPAPGHSR